METILMNMEENIKNANAVKEVVIARLLTDGKISEEDAEKYTDKYQIIIVKLSWFQKWKKIFKPEEEDTYMYKYLKIID